MALGAAAATDWIEAALEAAMALGREALEATLKPEALEANERAGEPALKPEAALEASLGPEALEASDGAGEPILDILMNEI